MEHFGLDTMNCQNARVRSGRRAEVLSARQRASSQKKHGWATSLMLHIGLHFLLTRKRSLAWNALRKVRTRLILLDELHDARHGSDNKCMEFLSVLKKINNVLQISIIAAGTEQAEEFLKQDEQVDNRFQKFPLHLWQPNPEFARFVLSFEKALPLRKPSKLKDKAILGVHIQAKWRKGWRHYQSDSFSGPLCRVDGYRIHRHGGAGKMRLSGCGDLREC